MMVALGTPIVDSLKTSGPAVEVVSIEPRVPFASNTYTRWLSDRGVSQMGAELNVPLTVRADRSTVLNALIEQIPGVAGSVHGVLLFATYSLLLSGVTARANGLLSTEIVSTRLLLWVLITPTVGTIVKGCVGSGG